jgi:short-subunit dehydrogenase
LDKHSKMKSVLITGCSSGIGLCIAKGLKEKGYRVFASARSRDDVKNLQNLGFESLLLDLSSSESINAAVFKLYEMTDNIYALINNGAYGQAGALEDISRDALDIQFQSNVFGWHELTNLILPRMRNVNAGRIIYISSVLGFVAMPFRGPYVASKFAIEGLIGTLRLEFSDTNIKFSSIQPGPIESKFRENAYLAFKKNVDISNSHYQDQYKIMIKRLQSGKNVKFTLPPEAVLKNAIHALESSNPKNYYRVTFPTKLFALLGNILPSRWMDYILNKS